MHARSRLWVLLLVLTALVAGCSSGGDAAGPRTSPTEPNKVDIPAGQSCSPSQGAPGFTVTDTRTLRDVKTGAVKTERRTTKYNPSPIVTCGSE